MQFVIIVVILCVPACSTGIVKREIQEINTTEPIWQPIKITNKTSVNVTTTTTSPIKTSSSIAPATTKRLLRKITTTTTEKHSTHATTTEKYAERISNDNATETTSSKSVTDSQPVTNKDNLDDDAEVISIGDVDGATTTTEEHRFDLSR